MFVIDKEKCTGCMKCAEGCPLDAIVLSGDKAEINYDICGECGACTSFCPKNAISHVEG